MSEAFRTTAWGRRETQEYYRNYFGTVDIPRHSAKELLDKDGSLVHNLSTGRIRAIRKQLAKTLGE